ncbi:YggT family protein [Candidatus Peregrinibacteria bacterium]|nr:YggT family protein [Candidatus Peregrinibacteria bacterium]
MEYLLSFLITVLDIIKYAIFARVIISWIQVNPYNRIVRFIYEVTEPILKVVRNILPRTGMIDLSPILAFFAIGFVQVGLLSLMSNL